MARPSSKPVVIKYIWDRHYDANTGTLKDPNVTLDEVAAAIQATVTEQLKIYPKPLKANNPANFVKDIVRRPDIRPFLPNEVVNAGYIIEQLVGSDMCFRFIPFSGATGATASGLQPSADALKAENVHRLESISIPLASRRLGRPDESWLAQVSARLNLVATHLALFSNLPVVALDLLQTGMKLGNSEIDAVFLATLSPNGNDEAFALVSCEVKSVKEALGLEQVERGATRLAKLSASLNLGAIETIPMGVKALGGGLIWVAEFDTVFPPLQLASEQVYTFAPPLKGVS